MGYTNVFKQDHLRRATQKYKEELDSFAPVVSNMSELSRRKTLKSDIDSIKLGAHSMLRRVAASMIACRNLYNCFKYLS